MMIPFWLLLDGCLGTFTTLEDAFKLTVHNKSVCRPGNFVGEACDDGISWKSVCIRQHANGTSSNGPRASVLQRQNRTRLDIKGGALFAIYVDGRLMNTHRGPGATMGSSGSLAPTSDQTVKPVFEASASSYECTLSNQPGDGGLGAISKQQVPLRQSNSTASPSQVSPLVMSSASTAGKRDLSNLMAHVESKEGRNRSVSVSGGTELPQDELCTKELPKPEAASQGESPKRQASAKESPRSGTSKKTKRSPRLVLSCPRLSGTPSRANSKPGSQEASPRDHQKIQKLSKSCDNSPREALVTTIGGQSHESSPRNLSPKTTGRSPIHMKKEEGNRLVSSDGWPSRGKPSRTVEPSHDSGIQESRSASTMSSSAPHSVRSRERIDPTDYPLLDNELKRSPPRSDGTEVIRTERGIIFMRSREASPIGRELKPLHQKASALSRSRSPTATPTDSLEAVKSSTEWPGDMVLSVSKEGSLGHQDSTHPSKQDAVPSLSARTVSLTMGLPHGTSILLVVPHLPLKEGYGLAAFKSFPEQLAELDFELLTQLGDYVLLGLETLGRSGD